MTIVAAICDRCAAADRFVTPRPGSRCQFATLRPVRHSPIVRWCCTARLRDYHVGTPVLFVHHRVRRNGRDYRDYWLNLVNALRVVDASVMSGFPSNLPPGS